MRVERGPLDEQVRIPHEFGVVVLLRQAVASGQDALDVELGSVRRVSHSVRASGRGFGGG